MCPSSVWRPSAGNDSFEEFADHWTMNPRPCWFTLSLRPGSTIAICYWPEHQSLLTTTWSGSWTLQRELWAAGRSTTAAWHTCFTLSYISMMWQIESHTYIHTYIHTYTYIQGDVYKCLHGQAPDTVRIELKPWNNK